MKFKGTPNLVIKDSRTDKKVGRFDENGIMEVTDPYMIERAKSKYPIVGEPAPKETAPDKKDEQPEKATPEKVAAVRTCKTCGAKFTSQGDILKHYKDKHPKEKKA
jgi:hypothetical protein